MLPTVVYDQFRFWLPVVSGFVLAYKGFKSLKASIDGWAETLFKNHLNHIQTATMDTVAATNETNKLLATAAIKNLEVAQHVAEVKANLVENQLGIKADVASVKTDIKNHEEKEMAVWVGVVNTLAILEDRAHRTPRRRSRG